ncbi:MAG TPA: hypothetical protein VGK50_02115 [Coriobacteriia bacterium]|jgi:hypothetical protein
MSKSAESYALTRFNAMRWGTAVDGPRHCPGCDRCRYRWCEAENAAPGQRGNLCWWETAYAQMYADCFSEQYGYLVRADSIEDFTALARRAAVLALNRLRVTTRSNAAWELRDVDGKLSNRAFKEFDICDRYYIAAINGEKEIMRRLDEAHDELVADVERRRAHSRMLSRPVGSTRTD